MSALAKAAALLSPRPSSRAVGPIGVDFSLEAVHLVQLQTGETGLPEVRARTSVAYDRKRSEILSDQHAFGRLLKKALMSCATLLTA